MALIWTLIGWPVASRLFPRPVSWFWAPALGFALHSVIALPLLGWIGMGRLSIVVTTFLIVAAAFALMRVQRERLSLDTVSLALMAATAGAAILALVPAMAALPKVTAEGMTLSASIFDHSKIAMIDEMIRAGVPLHNPFFSETGVPDRLAYYYLWHFSAATVAMMIGIDGWEADAALTWFTAFASLLTMIGLTQRLGGKVAAPFIVIILAATASIRTLVDWFAPGGTTPYLQGASGLAGWLFQVAWAPQHLASASCVVLACSLLVRVADREREGWFATLILALVAAAGYETSIWVGGLTFVVAAAIIALFLLWSIEPSRRLGLLLHLAGAAALALALCFPFLRDQIATGAARGAGSPIGLDPVHVLGPAFPKLVRRVLDLPAYWLVYLPVEFGAFYPAGMIGMFVLLKRTIGPRVDSPIVPLAILAGVSLCVAWLLRSVIAYNNDLGWRAILPAILLLVVFAATIISQWPSPTACTASVLAALGIALSSLETFQFLREDIVASRTPSERLFATTPALWQAVRRHTPPDDRVANNPWFLEDMTPWGANISWALLGDRRSCYAGYDLATAFAPIAAAERIEINQRFRRVFSGEPAEDDIEQLAKRFDCSTIVVTPQDGAWQHDPFAASAFYRLVETRADAWRIYRRAKS